MAVKTSVKPDKEVKDKPKKTAKQIENLKRRRDRRPRR